MRIIGGKFSGHSLVSPKGNSIRPTSDRHRESIFGTLIHKFGDNLIDARVLDLFAGTGTLGLEAISRGANHCLFVDISAEARANIRSNVEKLGLTGRTRIFRRDATKLGNVENIQPFDLVFLDPPYNQCLGESALISAQSGGWLKPDSLCVLEEDSRASIVIPDGFTITSKRITGKSQTLFLTSN